MAIENQEAPQDFRLMNKFADIEEKQKILRERILAFGDSFVKNKEDTNEDLSIIKSQLNELKFEIEKLKEITSHLLEESGNMARKEELASLQRFLKMWEPLKFVKEEEVRKIIKEELKK
jgi:predicted  nucleic acid-binding Zn-ribbon protein